MTPKMEQKIREKQNNYRYGGSEWEIDGVGLVLVGDFSKFCKMQEHFYICFTPLNISREFETRAELLYHHIHASS